MVQKVVKTAMEPRAAARTACSHDLSGSCRVISVFARFLGLGIEDVDYGGASFPH